MQRDLLILTIGELTETQQVANLLHVAYINERRTAEIALLLLGLLCQDVTVVGMVSLDLTCTGE